MKEIQPIAPNTPVSQNVAQPKAPLVSEALAARGFARKTEETPEAYRTRVDQAWEAARPNIEARMSDGPALGEQPEGKRETVQDLSSEALLAHSKTIEYLSRVMDGEDVDAVLKDHPMAEKLKAAITLGLKKYTSGPNQAKSAHEHPATPKENITADERNTLELLSREERRKLVGWPASYALAHMAKQLGVDLSMLSREDYAQFAIDNELQIDDNQLRVAPWQRMMESPEEINDEIKRRRAMITSETAESFDRFMLDTIQTSKQADRFIEEGIRVRQGTQHSNSWLFFGINQGTGERSDTTYKSYLSFKDLNDMTPDRLRSFMRALRDGGYNGDIKTFQDLTGQGPRLNDQVVMHGASEEDAKRGLEIAERFFADQLDQKSMGKDQVINGKEMSYSQVLAEQIAHAIHPEMQKTSSSQ